MKRKGLFIAALIKKCLEDDILSLSNELTYKLLLAFFPLLIFLMTVIGFLDLDATLILNISKDTLPDEIVNLITVFMQEVVNVRHGKLLTVSLLITVFSVSSGFNAIIRGVNKAYGVKETRNFILVRCISFILVFLFTLTIIVSIIVILFGGNIINFINEHVNMGSFRIVILDFAVIIATFVIIVLTIMTIYKFSISSEVSYKGVIPGSLLTVVLWFAATKLFSFYINNFASYSTVYGSIGSLFVLMFWLNITSFILLFGVEFNVLLEKT